MSRKDRHFGDEHSTQNTEGERRICDSTEGERRKSVNAEGNGVSEVLKVRGLKWTSYTDWCILRRIAVSP